MSLIHEHEMAGAGGLYNIEDTKTYHFGVSGTNDGSNQYEPDIPYVLNVTIVQAATFDTGTEAKKGHGPILSFSHVAGIVLFDYLKKIKLSAGKISCNRGMQGNKQNA